jgi:hypothetical protein
VAEVEVVAAQFPHLLLMQESAVLEAEVVAQVLYQQVAVQVEAAEDLAG